MNFAEKVETALSRLRIARLSLDQGGMESHRKELDRTIKDLDQAVKDYWEAENG